MSDHFFNKSLQSNNFMEEIEILKNTIEYYQKGEEEYKINNIIRCDGMSSIS